MQETTVTLGPGVVEWQEKNLEHLRYEYDINPGDLVYDLGSFEGEFAKRFRHRGADVREFEAANNTAAWVEDGFLTFGGNSNTRSSFSDQNVKQYKCVDIARVVREENRPIKLMKINIEGGEYAVLSHLFAQGQLGKIENIQVQFHCVSSFDYKLLYMVLSRQLRETHALTWRYAFCWENWKIKI